MEFARSGDDGGLNQDKRSDDDDDLTHHKQDNTILQESPMNNINAEKSVEGGTSTFSVKKEEVDEQLETTKAEMGEVREENERLKMCLNKIMNEYRVLQMKFHHIVKQETRKGGENDDIDKNEEILIEEPEQLVFLSLGRVPSRKDEEKVIKVPKAISMKDDEELTLGLDCKFEASKSGSTAEALPNNNNNHNQSPGNSCEVPKEDEAGETNWPPSKALNKPLRDVAEDEVSQQNPAKKARVCVRARCDTPTMNDGCQWRKYGQKIAKGNPCPRAYYRCTVAPSCPVRKQVQRCAEDMSILITTYEGTHNHPLPLSATAMASTTSAAASMLLSGSSTSNNTSMPSTNTPSNLHGLNHLYQHPSDSSKSKQIYLSNTALSSSPSHPTITLDLTSNPSATSSSPFVRFSSNHNQPIRYPSSTSLSFTSSSSELSNNNNAMSWSNNISGLLLNYATAHQPYNNNSIIGNNNVNFGRQVQAQPPMENFYKSMMQKNNSSNNAASPDTIAAATKAITTDPAFQSALAAALSSFIGGGSNNSSGISTRGNNMNQGGDGENVISQKMKWAEMFPGAAASALASTSSSKVNNNGCAISSFLNTTTPVKAVQNGSLMFLPPSSLPKSASTSPGADNRDTSNN